MKNIDTWIDENLSRLLTFMNEGEIEWTEQNLRDLALPLYESEYLNKQFDAPHKIVYCLP